MYRIQKVKLKNYKFFYGETTIDLVGKNILLYGENGSGKSSLFEGLSTIFQSVFQIDQPHIRNPFDPKHPDNIRNRFCEDKDECAISIEMENEFKDRSSVKLSNDLIETKDVLRPTKIVERDNIPLYMISFVTSCATRTKSNTVGTLRIM